MLTKHHKNHLCSPQGTRFYRTLIHKACHSRSGEEHSGNGVLGSGVTRFEVQRTTWGSAQTQERLRTPVLKEPRRSAEALSRRRACHVLGEGSYAEKGVETKSTNINTSVCFPETQRLYSGSR